eukprot:909728-Amphidinium_carterae.1
MHRAAAISAIVQRTDTAHSQLVKHFMPEHPIYVPGYGEAAATFATKHGLVQGDPLSTLVFCVLYDHVVSQAHLRLAHRPHDAEIGGVAAPYIDDG